MTDTSITTNRLVRRLRLLPKMLVSYLRTKAATLRVVRAHDRKNRSTDSTYAVSDKVTILMSLRVAPRERLSILEVTLRQLALTLGQSGIHLRVDDASDPEVAEDVRAAFERLPMPAIYENSVRPMTAGYLDLLRKCRTDFCYLQFDDQVTTNLSPALLDASCKFLERYGQHVPVVSATWPTRVEVADEVIHVTTYEVGSNGRRTWYAFQSGRAISPVFVEKIQNHTFAVFENFMYGFYFNHVIVPVDDYRSRLQWYVDHVDASSAHRIEVAAARKTLGPFWTHVAVCLDDVAILDLDFQHTPAALRPVAATARQVFEALRQGSAIEARHTQR